MIKTKKKEWKKKWNSIQSYVKCVIKDAVCVCVWGGGNQAYSRISTTHGHISDCKLDSVVHAGVGCMRV